MKTSELVTFFKTHEFTDTVGYNLIINDLYEFIPEAKIVGGQELISYFMYKIQEVCFHTIRELKNGTPSEN